MSEQNNSVENDWIEGIKARDERSFSLLYYKYYSKLLNVANSYVNDPAAAEDVVHEVFERLYKNIHSIKIHTSVSAYLRTMVVNESLNYIKKNKRYVLNEPDDWSDMTASTDDIEEQETWNLAEEALQKAIAALPERCRLVFRLSRFEDFSHKKISEELNISTKTIENQITKAVKAIHKALIKYKNLSSVVILCTNMLLRQ